MYELSVTVFVFYDNNKTVSSVGRNNSFNYLFRKKNNRSTVREENIYYLQRDSNYCYYFSMKYYYCQVLNTFKLLVIDNIYITHEAIGQLKRSMLYYYFFNQPHKDLCLELNQNNN